VGTDDCCHTGMQIAVAELTYNPDFGPGEQLASGWCGSATRQFMHVLAAHGVKQGTTDDDISGHVDCHAYTDLPYRPLDEYGQPENPELSSSHCANIAFEGEHAYLIDCTASQYGYDALPMVRRTSADNGRKLAVMGDIIELAQWDLDW
jgi:hypothetical protein